MIAVLGAGAFGTGLAIALAAEGHPVTLWGRDGGAIAALRRKEPGPHLPGAALPDGVRASSHPDDTDAAGIVLLAVPMQALRGLLDEWSPRLRGRILVSCAKGIDGTTLTGASGLLSSANPDIAPLVLTGPSFAADLARGQPTALTLACRDPALGAEVQAALATQALRPYLNDDVTGAELGGAMKNVIAIAAGAAIGAGFGDSARAAILTRGLAEMTRLGVALGARAETFAGLSGLGDLVLTATSPQSRNFRRGLALGAGDAFDPGVTVEGVATAVAADALGRKLGIDLPITAALVPLLAGRAQVRDVLGSLLSRPLRQE